MATDSPLLLRTDQTGCWDADGRKVPCAGTGQEAEAGPPLDPTGRFEVRDGIAHDRLTGLEWPQDAGFFAFPFSWPEAGEAVSAMNREGVLGRNGWRLPDRRELFSLVSHNRVNPALPDGHPFENVFDGYYWTKDTCARLPDQAWYVHLGGGRVQKGMKHGSYMVLPVRPAGSGEAEGEGRFEKDGRLLRDLFSGRTWLLPENREAASLTWQQALQYAVDLNHRNTGGFDDWRLASIRELDGLTDLSRHSPALAEAFGPAPGVDGYWSSTTSVYETRYAWVLYPRDGAVGVGFKAKPTFHPLVVRGF